MRSFACIVIWFIAFLVQAADRPNIIWIVGEDLGPELRCYDDSYSHTPNIDRLAREGARFTRAFNFDVKPSPPTTGAGAASLPTS